MGIGPLQILVFEWQSGDELNQYRYQAMRNLSRLGLKLLGILLVYWTLSDLCRALADIPLLFIQWSPADKPALMRALRREGLAADIFECIASGAFAAFVLARTEWIISKLRLPEEIDSVSIMAPEEVLRVCLIVVGSVAVIKGIPGFAEGLTYAFVLLRGVRSWDALPDKTGFFAIAKVAEMNMIGEGAASFVEILFGCAVILKSRALAATALAL
jgi:hypothetical protein